MEREPYEHTRWKCPLLRAIAEFRVEGDTPDSDIVLERDSGYTVDAFAMGVFVGLAAYDLDESRLMIDHLMHHMGVPPAKLADICVRNVLAMATIDMEWRMGHDRTN